MSAANEPIDLQALVRDLNELLVLAVVGDGPAHGYRIALDLGERTDGMFALQHGTLYPILHRLEKAGLLAGSWSDGSGRRRKEYRLTADGRRRLASEGERLVRVLETVRGVLGKDAHG